MVTAAAVETARAAVAAVCDPEMPVLTIDDLGVLRDVRVDERGVVVTITPTYSGCPAMDAIRDDIVRALAHAGFDRVSVETVLSPAWTTDWMSDAARRKLVAAGIAPPSGRASLARSGSPVRVRLAVRCPRCGSLDTQDVSRFGATSCTALFSCRACREPFDHVKAL